MKHILAFLLVAFFSFPAQAEPGIDRYSPMGDRTAAFQKRIYSNELKTVIFNYYFLGPKEIDKTAKYPLIVVLHGRSGHAYGAYKLAEEILINQMPAFVVVPVMEEFVNDWTQPLFKAQDAALPKPIDHVVALTKRLAANLPIDSSRLYVTGYSMGGVGTYGALHFYPGLFAAAIPICGGWYPKDAASFVSTPLWAFHGDADKSVPVKETINIIGAIRKKGGTPEMTIYPGVGHNSWEEAYNEPQLWTWLFLHAKKTP